MSKLYKSSEVESHNSRKSCWIVIRNDVYDVTNYLGEHPGGEEPLLESAGMDATTAFEAAGHSSYAKKQLKKFKIGSLAPGEKCDSPMFVYRCCESSEKALDGKKPCNRSPSNRSPSNRSRASSVHKCYSKSDLSNRICSKSATSLRKQKSKSATSLVSKRSNLKKGHKADPNVKSKPEPTAKSTPEPVPIPRVQSIVVPRSSGSKLKYALLALAIAIIAGVAYKKYAAS